ncbi:hypothetical protein N665_0072s0025 [Sinapis alba]|nr:hypothetical protein N665_0072s0025 [Sinapis alba]
MEDTVTHAVNTTSPDLLKNTPSNIARLEDVIEQCHGRQKSLSQTISPSDGSDVCWYFCKVPLADHGQENNMMDKVSTVLEHHDVIQETPSLVSDSVVDTVGLEIREGQEDDHYDDSSAAVSSQDGAEGADCRTHDSSSCSPEQSWEKKCYNSNNEEMIKLLREELFLIKGELSFAPRKTKISTIPEQHISEKAPTKDASAPSSFTPYIKYRKLKFKVDTFFAIGSPLGVFLALRNIRLGIGKRKYYWEEENVIEEMPACRRMFNIFHPYDPVAYRVEPLVCKEYLPKRPVIVPYHRGGKRLHIGLQDFKEDFAARSQRVMNNFDSIRTRVLTICQSKSSDELEGKNSPQLMNLSNYFLMLLEQRRKKLMTKRMEGHKEKTFKHPYLQAIGAHT